jgi:hypothetical protein
MKAPCPKETELFRFLVERLHVVPRLYAAVASKDTTPGVGGSLTDHRTTVLVAKLRHYK